MPQRGAVHGVPRPVQGDALGDRERRADRRSRARRKADAPRELWWLLAAAVVLVVLVVAFLPQFSTMQPGYYRRYAGHARPHGELEELDARPCQLHRVPRRTRRRRALRATGSPRFPPSTRSSSWALRRPTCSSRRVSPHVRSATRTTARYRPTATCSSRIGRTSVVLKMNCVECHKDLVHSANEKGYNSPKMATCFDEVPQRQDRVQQVHQVPYPEADSREPCAEELAGGSQLRRRHGRLRLVPRVDAGLLRATAIRSVPSPTSGTGRPATPKWPSSAARAVLSVTVARSSARSVTTSAQPALNRSWRMEVVSR